MPVLSLRSLGIALGLFILVVLIAWWVRKDNSPEVLFLGKRPESYPPSAKAAQVAALVANDINKGPQPLNTGIWTNSSIIEPGALGDIQDVERVIAPKGHRAYLYGVPLVLVARLPQDHPAYFRYQFIDALYGYLVDEVNGKLIIVSRPKPEDVERLREIADATGVDAKKIAVKKLETLDRYKHWLEEGWEYTITMTLDTQTSTKAGAVWQVYFDTTLATDQAIWMTVDTGKGAVTEVIFGEA